MPSISSAQFNRLVAASFRRAGFCNHLLPSAQSSCWVSIVSSQWRLLGSKLWTTIRFLSEPAAKDESN